MISQYDLSSQLETLRFKRTEIKEKYDDLLSDLINEMDKTQLDKLIGFNVNPSQKIESIDENDLAFIIDGFWTPIVELNINEMDNILDFIKNNIFNK